MEFIDKIKEKIQSLNQANPNDSQNQTQNVNKQIGLEVRLPGCENFVPLGKDQYNRIYLDDIGPRLLIIADECAELIEPGGVKTTEGKEEDAMKAEIVGLMKSITQLGRSSGIHMVLAPLRLSTIIPTTKGYKTMETIEVGDLVFDENNSPIEVLNVAPIKMSEEMYELTLIKGDKKVIIGSDNNHRFPILINDSKEINTFYMKEILEVYKKEQNVYILGLEENWLISDIKKIKNELVRCIEVNSKNHIFAIIGENIKKGGDDVNDTRDFVFTFNTQRNDASIIP